MNPKELNYELEVLRSKRTKLTNEITELDTRIIEIKLILDKLKDEARRNAWRTEDQK